MEYLTESTWWAFTFQVLLWSIHIPLSYVAFLWARIPVRRHYVRSSLSQLGIVETEDLEKMVTSEYRLKNYLWPILFAWIINSVVYIMTHPYAIQSGLWAGTLEEVIDVFGSGDRIPRAIVAGRFLFWGWAGAYIFSFHLIFRRFMAHDLTPSVYFFTGNRFALAFVVSSIVGVGVGTLSTASGVSFDVNVAMVSVIAFFIGFFPEQGVNWITATAQKFLKQQGGISKELPLSEIEGLSIWHQGRLKQEGIDNVQNLATADIAALVIGTPFTINQIIDWVDQAILLVYSSQIQFQALERVGIRCASDFLVAASDPKYLEQLHKATKLERSELRTLHLAQQSASNIAPISHFRWQSRLNEAEQAKATVIYDKD